MEPTEPIAFVRYYNAWRVGGDMDQPNPTTITRMLTELCDHVERLERELEQERQDRVQAENDVCRALGERNDARDELAASQYREGAFQVEMEKERALADRLATAMFGCPSTEADNALAAWKEARRAQD